MGRLKKPDTSSSVAGKELERTATPTCIRTSGRDVRHLPSGEKSIVPSDATYFPRRN